MKTFKYVTMTLLLTIIVNVKAETGSSRTENTNNARARKDVVTQLSQQLTPNSLPTNDPAMNQEISEMDASAAGTPNGEFLNADLKTCVTGVCTKGTLGGTINNSGCDIPGANTFSQTCKRGSNSKDNDHAFSEDGSI